MQARMQTMQEEMAQRTFSALAGGGMVTADVDGKMQLKRIQIDPAILNDKEMVEDLIVVAVAEAQKKAAEAMQIELQKVTGGLNLPFQLPF
jgi:DNA-binding YbaB/EbfC family protein